MFRIWFQFFFWKMKRIEPKNDNCYKSKEGATKKMYGNMSNNETKKRTSRNTEGTQYSNMLGIVFCPLG